MRLLTDTHSTINGILEMTSFREQFATETDEDGIKKILPSQISIIVAILSAGTVFGALLSSPIADWMGRRLSLILAVGVFSFGAVFQVCASSIPILLVGRFVRPLPNFSLSAFDRAADQN